MLATLGWVQRGIIATPEPLGLFMQANYNISNTSPTLRLSRLSALLSTTEMSRQFVVLSLVAQDAGMTDLHYRR